MSPTSAPAATAATETSPASWGDVATRENGLCEITTEADLERFVVEEAERRLKNTLQAKIERQRRFMAERQVVAKATAILEASAIARAEAASESWKELVSGLPARTAACETAHRAKLAADKLQND